MAEVDKPAMTSILKSSWCWLFVSLFTYIYVRVCVWVVAYKNVYFVLFALILVSHSHLFVYANMTPPHLSTISQNLSTSSIHNFAYTIFMAHPVIAVTTLNSQDIKMFIFDESTESCYFISTWALMSEMAMIAALSTLLT